MNDMTPVKTSTPKDWETDQEVRWCPGCGDYAILKAVQKTLADMNVTRENTVFVSGIGCAAHVLIRFSLVAFDFLALHQKQGIFEHRGGISALSRLTVPEGSPLQIAFDAEASRHDFG